jgi:hypothetical protein
MQFCFRKLAEKRYGAVEFDNTHVKGSDTFAKEYCLVSFELRSKDRCSKLKNNIFHAVYPFYSYVIHFFHK